MEQVTIDIRGMIDGYGYQLSNVRYLLKQNKGKQVLCRVNSFGGSVNDAMMISQEFADHGNVTVRFLGFCASAATWMAFGAKRIEMAEDAFWLCHKSSVTVDIWKQMNSDDLEATIKQLQKDKKNQEAIDLTIAKKYADRSGKSVEDMLALMNEARWLKAEEVKALGFVDDIVKADGKSFTKQQQQSIVANCAALNMPTPTFDPDNESPSLIDRLKRVFSFKEETTEEPENNAPLDTPVEDTVPPVEDSQENSHQIQKTMNSEFTNLNSLLSVEGVEVADNQVTLTVEQLQTIENALSERDTIQQAVNKATATLDSISDTVKDIEGLNNKVLAMKNVLDRMPLTAPAAAVVPGNSAEDTKQKELAEDCKDPINELARTW